MFLQKLSVSGFRGIGDTLDLTLGHRTILYGPNGSGKSSLLQSIAWSLYGKLPTYVGGVFVKEDALVNDFLDQAKSEVKIVFSTGDSISRYRQKQISTTRGANPLEVSFSKDDPQEALEKLICLNSEEFFASVFLHQETIRDFLTTSPEKRSATIDRMIGTYLLRAIIKSVNPNVPDKAIRRAEADIDAIDALLSSATVISREVIDQKKAEYGDPSTLPEKLEEIRSDLLPLVEQFGLPVPGTTINELSASLDEVRHQQIESIRYFTAMAGDILTLKQKYKQASDSNWEAVRRQRAQFGDPASLPGLLKSIGNQFTPLRQQLGLPEPNESLSELQEDLEEARSTQNVRIGSLTQEAAELNRLKDRYIQAAVTDWQGLKERKSKWGEIKALPSLLKDIHESLSPKLTTLGISVPQPTLVDLEDGLAAAQRIQPREVGRLERLASDYLDLRNRYLQAKQNLIESPAVSDELLKRQAELDSKVKNLNSRILELNKQVGERDALFEEIKKLRDEINELQDLKISILQDQVELDRLEKESQQGRLFNQLSDIGSRYLEQARPDHCPLCKQSIEDIDNLLVLLRRDIPADLDKLQKEIRHYKDRIGSLRDRVTRLEGKQTQLDSKEASFSTIPTDLERQINKAQEDRSQAAEHLTKVNAEIDQVKARISMADLSRRTMEAVLVDVKSSLGQTSIPDPESALELAAQAAREQASEINNIDFQPLIVQLSHAKQLEDMANEEERLQHRLRSVLDEITKAIGSFDDAAVPSLLDRAIYAREQQALDIQAIDFQPIARDLERAFQLQQIQEEESRLNAELDRVQAEIRQKLNLVEDQDELLSCLDKTIDDAHNQAQKTNELDLHPIENKLQIVRKIEEIVIDEEKLRSLENRYHTAQREKNRLNYRIGRLIELRNALHDISETTKRRQEDIVSEVLNNLDIGRYYEQLDPHPAYTELQIEPESSASGTYKYWIRARTEDFDHSAYVQARFSTAQANSAAIAIFLAVNQHLSKSLETVLLDDPSQSMDPENKKRLAQTLASYPRQVIVATEDPQMFSHLQEAFTSPVIYELMPWSTTGAALVKK